MPADEEPRTLENVVVNHDMVARPAVPDAPFVSVATGNFSVEANVEKC